MKLYFDIGNTNIKLNFKYEDQEFYISFPTNASHTVDSLYNELPSQIKNAQIESVAIVSVVPKKLEILEQMSIKYWQKNPMILGYPLKSGVKINVDNPKSVGADLVALSSLATTLGENIIIVNMGTATTFINVKNKELQGVIISAGLQTQLDSLSEKSCGLTDILMTPTKKQLGKNTQEAISIGILHGHIEMIKGIINRIDPEAKVYISGGHSWKIKDLIDYEFIIEATIEGLKHVEKINGR